jgi:hypothetical protein
MNERQRNELRDRNRSECENDKLCPWSSVVTWVGVIVAVLLSAVAVDLVAYLLGWLTGVSKSPIVAAIAPLIFGLLALVGLGVGWTYSNRRWADWLRTSVTAVLVIVFCIAFNKGVSEGSYDRVDAYQNFSTIVTASGTTLKPETYAAFHRFRLQARQADVPSGDFKAVVRDVFVPILTQEDKTQVDEQMQAAVRELESAFTPSTDAAPTT